MTYKQIEASREVRLWIGQVIVPAIALTMAIPEARKKVIDKSKSIKRSIDERFKKTNSKLRRLGPNGSFLFREIYNTYYERDMM